MEWVILGSGAVVLAILVAIQRRMIRLQHVKPVMVPYDLVDGWLIEVEDAPCDVCIDMEMDSMDDMSANLDRLRR